ncbi:hypothetical protein [Terriglobus sp. ADX1]|uniref:hypothetical protein n=1 Tax=Terriglobus sp. ADX1 TaxID=2794063 RepID=UPI002FE5A5CF
MEHLHDCGETSHNSALLSAVSAPQAETQTTTNFKRILFGHGDDELHSWEIPADSVYFRAGSGRYIVRVAPGAAVRTDDIVLLTVAGEMRLATCTDGGRYLAVNTGEMLDQQACEVAGPVVCEVWCRQG